MTLPYLTPLTAQQQRSFGIAQPAPYAHADKVRFGEIDMLGHVNNAAYFSWFETARTRYLEHHGLTKYDPAHDPRIVLRSGDIHYIQEMRRDEDYITTVRCTQFRTTSLTVEQNIWAASTLRTRFSCVMVALTADGSSKLPLPASFTQKLEQIDGATRA